MSEDGLLQSIDYQMIIEDNVYQEKVIILKSGKCQEVVSILCPQTRPQHNTFVRKKRI